MSPQETSSTPDFHVCSGNTKPLGHFVEGQHSPFTQAVKAALQSVFDREAGNHAAAEWLAVARDKTTRVQDAGDGLGRMLIQQPIDLGHHSSLRPSRGAGAVARAF